MMFNVNAALDKALASKTDEEREQEAQKQKEWRASIIVPSDVQIKAQHGDRLVALSLKALDRNPDSAFELTRLAEGYALQGKYQLAAETTKDPAKRAAYITILSAINGASECNCPKTYQSGKHVIETRFVKERILTERGIKDLRACALCGRLTC